MIVVWLLGLTLWIYYRQRNDEVIWQRFDDVDQRDLDYKDVVDVRLAKLERRSKPSMPNTDW